MLFAKVTKYPRKQLLKQGGAKFEQVLRFICKDGYAL